MGGRGLTEAAVVVDEGDGVYGAQMVVVFLGQLAGAGVILDYLFVGHAGEELVRAGGVEGYAVGDCASFETRDAGAGFGVPSARQSVLWFWHEG